MKPWAQKTSQASVRNFGETVSVSNPMRITVACLLLLLSGFATAAKFNMSFHTGAGTPTLVSTADDTTTTFSATKSDSSNMPGVSSGFLDPDLNSAAVSYTLVFSTPLNVTQFQIGEFTNLSAGANYTFTPNSGTTVTIADNSGSIVGAIATLNPGDWTSITSLTVSYAGAASWRLGLDNIIFTVASVAPAISIDNSNLLYTENDAVTQIDSAATLSDADGDAEWNGGTLVAQITANNEAADELSIPDNIVGTINTSGTNLLNGGTTIGTLSASEGTVTNGTALTITFNSNATNALAQQVLRALHYRNTSDDPGTSNRTITVTATDKNTTTANDTRTVAITAVNDEPTLTATGSNPTFTEGGAAASLFSGASVSTIESGQTITGFTLTVTNLADGSNEILNADGTAIALTNGNSGTTASNSLSYSVSVAGSTATVTFSGGTVSTAATQTLVNSMSYQNNSNDPDTTNRVVTLTSITDSGSNTGANDNVAALAVATTVTVIALNDEPTLTATGSNPTFTEGGSAASLFSGTSVSTVESGQTLAGFTLTVTNLADGSNEILNADGTAIALTNGNSGTTATNSLSYSVSVSGSTATVTFSGGTMSTAATQTLVNSMSYQNNSNDPGTSNRVITLTSLTDSGSNTGANDNIAALAVASTVTITALNDEPTLTATGSNPTFTEGGAAASLFSGSSISTVESGQTLTGFTLTVTNLADGSNEILNADGTAIALTNGNSGTTASNSLSYSVSVAGSTATVTFSGGTVSAAAAQTLVDAMSYQNNSNDPNTTNRVVTLTSLTDSGSNTGANDNIAALAVASTVTVTAVNDEPTLTATGSNPTFKEGGSAASLFSAASISTIESGQTITGLTLTITNLADGSNEILNADGTAIVLTNGTSGTTASNSLSYSVSVAGSTATVTFSGGTLSSAAAQTLIDALSYQNNSSGPGTANRVVTLTSVTDSGSNTGANDNIAALAVTSTVSVLQKPTITSATYNYSSNILTATGVGFLPNAGVTNDIVATLFTLTGEGGATYTLASSSNVEITSGTEFSIVLTGADLFNVEALLNKDGNNAAGGTPYNLAAAEDWNPGADTAIVIADAATSITVSNYTPPAIDAAGSGYDWATGQLSISATNLVNFAGAANDLDASLLTFTGEGGTYTLTNSSDVELTSSTAATFTLSATDQLNVHGLLNKNGTSSSGATTYNLAAADNWVAGSPAALAIEDLTGNGVAVSNVCTPAITSTAYDADTGVVTVTGTCFFKKIGAANDVDISMFTFTGGTGNATYTLTSATDVEINSATSFSFTLAGADKTNVDALLDQLGATSSGGSTYNIEAADNWLTGADAATNIADATTPISVTVNPKIDSATYNPSTGVLVVTGTNIQANGGGSDIDASTFTLTGEAGGTYQLTDTADVERDSVTQFTLTLSATDRTAVNALLNNTGTQSADLSTYNLAAADNWDTNVTLGDTSDATATIAVTNVAPTLTNLAGDTVSFFVAGNAVNLDSSGNATLADLTTPNLNGGNVTATIVTNGQNGEDVLTIGNVGAITLSGSNVMHSDSSGTLIGTVAGGTAGAALVITLNSNATLARVRDVLSALQYRNTDVATNNLATRTVRITVDDGDGGSSTSSNQDVSVNVVRAPIIDLDGNDSSGGTNGGYKGSAVGGGGTVAAADSDNVITDDGTFKSLTVTLTNRPDGAAESLSSTFGTGAQIVNAENVTIGAYSSGTGILSITIDDNDATAATLQQLIGSIRYRNTSSSPNTAARSITFSATDNADNIGPAATATITVAPANAAPTLSGGPVILGTTVTDASSAGKQVSSILSSVSYADSDGGNKGIAIIASTGTGTWQFSTNNTTWTNFPTISANSALLLSSASYVRFSAGATPGTASISFRGWDQFSGTASTNGVEQRADASLNGGITAFSTGTASGTVTVTQANQAPQLSGTPSASATVGALYRFTPVATDADTTDVLSFSLTNAPGWLSVDANTGVVSGTPGLSDIGAATGITLSVSDGKVTVSLAAFSITVFSDLDLDGIADDVDPDIDGDGMDNEFETANGLDPRDASDALTDLDGDGVDNLTEFEEGMNVGADDVAPMLTVPSDITLNATGLFTEVTAERLGSALAVDGLDGNRTPTSNAKSHYEPGVHVITWEAMDVAGNKATAEQRVSIIPLVEFSKNQSVAEDSGLVSFKAILNGNAVTYPVSVPFTVEGTADETDHTLLAGTATISTGREAVITFSILDDGITGEAIETVNVLMGTPVNAVIGPKSTHLLKIIEGNAAPKVSLQATQNGIATRTVTAGSAAITVKATVTDPNQNDTHTFDWAGTDSRLSDTDTEANSFTFTPVNIGAYALKVVASDNGSPIASGSGLVTINVVASLVTLGSDDSDGDGVDDQTEGHGDSDGDGIADFLDAIDARTNTLPAQAGVFNQFVVESEPGLRLSLGVSAFELNNGKASLTEEQATSTGGGTADDEDFEFPSGLFDFIVDDIPDASLSVNVVVPQFVQIPADAVYRKLMPTGWQNFVEDTNNAVASAPGNEGFCPPPGDAAYVSGLNEGDWCVQLTIEDGGPNDADGQADTRITDPGGVARLIGVEPEENENTSSRRSSGGALGASLILLLLMGVLGARRRNRYF